jgi:hypothetical protein
MKKACVVGCCFSAGLKAVHFDGMECGLVESKVDQKQDMEKFSVEEKSKHGSQRMYGGFGVGSAIKKGWS